MIRSITTQFLPALRQAGSRRLNSGGGTIAVSNRESEYEKFMTPFKDPGIKAGNHAYVWEVPKNLPSNDFIKRREAVATHAECRSTFLALLTVGSADGCSDHRVVEEDQVCSSTESGHS